ncbi:MAG: OmpA family protein [Nannocystaceae bacterium]|nr:OmpA family protein [Nannocystaceae bacterium]
MGGFEKDSCFPTPTALSIFLAIALEDGLVDLFKTIFGAEADPPDRVFQIYGHTDSTGDEGGNKGLSERRAEAMRAILVGDVDAFVTLGEAEQWGHVEQQVMLRTLQCDPGPIDGEPGPLMDRAVADFQADYVAGAFHAHVGPEPKQPGLLVDGELGPKTNRALLGALVGGCSPQIPPEQMHPTHPAVGCSEFNQITEPSNALNRRVSLVVHEQLPAYYDAAPCREGDHAACPFDGRARSGCLWYREHVQDPVAQDFVHHHYDLRWLPLPNGGVLLSALTTLNEVDEVTFQVCRAGDVSGPEDIHEGNLASSISEPMLGLVRSGVAQVVWVPDVKEGGFDPFDADAWYVHVDLETAARDPAAVWRKGPRLRPPVFTVSGGGTKALSKPPGQDPHRIRVETDEGDPFDASLTAVGVDVYGRVVRVPLEGGRSTFRPGIRGATAELIEFEVPGGRSVPDEGQG